VTEPEILSFFDEATSTASHIIADPVTKRCAIIDTVLDYDAASGTTSTVSAEKIVAAVQEKSWVVDWILETHVHADHLSAAPFLKRTLGGQSAIGANISIVQGVFGDLLNAEPEFYRDGRQFDVLFEDGSTFSVGEISGKVIATPGHTPACISYLIGGVCFVGDTLFMPDFGTARCDFPGGDAAILYQSVQKLFCLPDKTRMFLCHDYLSDSRQSYCWESSVGAQKKENIHIHEGVSESEFVRRRTERDAQLGMPKLIFPSVQVNMRAGLLPKPEDNGQVYLKIPVDAFKA